MREPGVETFERSVAGRASRVGLAIVLAAGLTGCAGLMGSATSRMASTVSAAILAQDDPATVRDGAPAYLLLIDGLIRDDPDNPDLLASGARLYGAYAGAFVDDPDRAARLSGRALAYARRTLCLDAPDLCRAAPGPYDGFLAALARAGPGDVDALYGFATAWAGWVQTHADDPVAVADLPKIEAAFRRVVALDDGHDRGRAHLYLGVLYCLRPAALGGRPGEGRRQFERAIALSEGRDLMARVLFAEHYARLVFDRELHDRLLNGVLSADTQAGDLTLSNVLAQARARALLASAEDYF